MRVIILFLVLLGGKLSAQNRVSMSIPYGATIALNSVQETTFFTISGQDLSVRIKGKAIHDFVFSQPGEYLITVETNEPFTKGDCSHSSLPKEIALTVDRVRIKFDQQGLQFSSPIIKNKAMDGTHLMIPVIVETYDNQPVILNKQLVEVSGIGSSLTAQLESTSDTLPTGQHLLRYALKGKVTENAYLMFDFVQPNGVIQSIALQHPIQNQ